MFICSEKATKFCEISTVDLFYVATVKSTIKISQNFVSFSEYMNFTSFFNFVQSLEQCINHANSNFSWHFASLETPGAG